MILKIIFNLYHTTPRRWWRDKHRMQRRFQVCWRKDLHNFFTILFALIFGFILIWDQDNFHLGIQPHPRVPTTLRIFLTIPTSAISSSSSSSSSSSPSSSPSSLISFFFPKFFNFWRISANLSLLFFLRIRNCQKFPNCVYLEIFTSCDWFSHRKGVVHHYYWKLENVRK